MARAGPVVNAPLRRKSRPPCTSKETAEVCPEEQAPFRRWENARVVQWQELDRLSSILGRGSETVQGRGSGF